MGEGVDLPGPRSCDHQQRRCHQSSRSPVLHRTPLLGIEGFEADGCRLHFSVRSSSKYPSPVIPAVVATANQSAIA